ncbi:hypothetical protein J6590_006282 [Homalodisca vitripennis]|nr:hypothetical protein J6590_006282 [Homalodisca vitripennis]
MPAVGSPTAAYRRQICSFVVLLVPGALSLPGAPHTCPGVPLQSWGAPHRRLGERGDILRQPAWMKTCPGNPGGCICRQHGLYKESHNPITWANSDIPATNRTRLQILTAPRLSPWGQVGSLPLTGNIHSGIVTAARRGVHEVAVSAVKEISEEDNDLRVVDGLWNIHSGIVTAARRGVHEVAVSAVKEISEDNDLRVVDGLWNIHSGIVTAARRGVHEVAVSAVKEISEDNGYLRVVDGLWNIHSGIVTAARRGVHEVAVSVVKEISEDNGCDCRPPCR